MKKHSNLLVWLDKHILKILTVAFIYLIPLYPKFPLRILPDTYVAIRFEDLFVVVFCLVFLFQFVRKKVYVDRTFLILFSAYWTAVFLSFFWGHFVQGTILFNYIGFLHAARRVEYMAVFFIAAAVVRSRDDFFFYIRHVMQAALIVFLYGFGQRFLGFPAIQTMNKEFAKGMMLFLTPEARVSSTFAGHYDLAAYFVLIAPIILAYHIQRKSWFSFLIFVLGVGILVMTASRSSFGAYIVSIFGMLIVLRNWKYFLIVAALTALLTLSNNTMTSRFIQTFRVKQLFINEETGQVIVPQEITTTELPAGTTFVPIGIDKTETEKASNEAIIKKQFLKEIRQEASVAGKTLTQEEEQNLLAKRFTDFTPVVGVTADISFATRLQVEWPRAVDSFKTNPLLGTGPSSITEATDSSFFRWLGEFGLLASSLFMSIIFLIIIRVWRGIRESELSLRVMLYGFIFGLLGLSINGTYIDVFEASKVAYTLWLVAGIYIGALPHLLKSNQPV